MIISLVCAGLNFEVYKSIPASLLSLQIIMLDLPDLLHQSLPEKVACQQSRPWDKRPDSHPAGELWVAPVKKQA